MKLRGGGPRRQTGSAALSARRGASPGGTALKPALLLPVRCGPVLSSPPLSETTPRAHRSGSAEGRRREGKAHPPDKINLRLFSAVLRRRFVSVRAPTETGLPPGCPFGHCGLEVKIFPQGLAAMAGGASGGFSTSPSSSSRFWCHVD